MVAAISPGCYFNLLFVWYDVIVCSTNETQIFILLTALRYNFSTAKRCCLDFDNVNESSMLMKAQYHNTCDFTV